MVFTKQYGFRFSSCQYRELAQKVPVLSLDFASDCVGVWRGERRQRVVATGDGVVHAILASWEVYDGPNAQGGQGGGAPNGPSSGTAGGQAAGADASAPLVMSTHPDATLDNFPRDMQWGQGLQLIEDLAQASADAAPTPFVVTKGEVLTLVTRCALSLRRSRSAALVPPWSLRPHSPPHPPYSPPRPLSPALARARPAADARRLVVAAQSPPTA